MKRVTTAGVHTHPRRGGCPPQLPQPLPRVRRQDLPKVKLPRQSRKGGGKTKLTNHRAARILHVIGVLSRNRGAACRGDARDPVQFAAVGGRTVPSTRLSNAFVRWNALECARVRHKSGHKLNRGEKFGVGDLLKGMVGRDGIEPPTPGFSVLFSRSWKCA